MLKFLIKNKSSIIGFGSVSGLAGRNFNSNYAAAKRGLESFFESLAFEKEFNMIGKVNKHLNLQLESGIDKLFETLIDNKEINFKNRQRVMDICRDWYLLNNTNTLENFFE